MLVSGAPRRGFRCKTRRSVVRTTRVSSAPLPPVDHEDVVPHDDVHKVGLTAASPCLSLGYNPLTGQRSLQVTDSVRPGRGDRGPWAFAKTEKDRSQMT